MKKLTYRQRKIVFAVFILAMVLSAIAFNAIKNRKPVYKEPPIETPKPTGAF
jgi:hypothetical protein